MPKLAVGPLDGSISFDSAALIKSTIETAKEFIDAATPLVEDSLDIAVPKIQSGIDDATPLVKEGLERAASAVKSGIQTAVPVVTSLLQSVGSGVGAAALAASNAAISTLPLTPEQQATLNAAASATGQVGEVVGATAALGVDVAGKVGSVAVPLIEEGVRVGAPIGERAIRSLASTLQQGAESSLREVQPALEDLAREGRISDQTATRIQGDVVTGIAVGAQEMTRGVAQSLRTAATFLADDPVVEAAAGAGATKGNLLSLPSTKEVTDNLALSFSRAAAPYALGGAVLALGLSALRELAKPIEQTMRNLLATALLLLICRFGYENWDMIYSAYRLLSGEESIKLF